MGCKYYCLLLQQEIFSRVDQTKSEFALHDIIEVPLPAICKQLCSTAVSCDLSEYSIARKKLHGEWCWFLHTSDVFHYFEADTFVMMSILM